MDDAIHERGELNLKYDAHANRAHENDYPRYRGCDDPKPLVTNHVHAHVLQHKCDDGDVNGLL